jgi:PTH1 family peptidyl-tRNA hydrolase
MLLLVGLGNPNPNNSDNRHNVGFLVIDAINEKFKLSKQKPKFKGLLTTGKIDEQKIFAIKPLTFMNSSGVCIKELIEYFKIDVKDVFVFHDDMDIDLGKVKVKFGGSSAGHNGIESIDKNIGKNYSRIRIGIGRPTKNADSSDHVLDNFSIDEKENVKEVAQNIIGSLSVLINKDLDLFSSKINQKL